MSFFSDLTPLPVHPGISLQTFFVVVPLLVVLLFAFKLRSFWFLVAGIGWMVLTGLLGASLWLTDPDPFPPRIIFLLAPTFGAAFWIGFSSLGGRIASLPWAFLVGYQAFRILIEIGIHWAVEEGVSPPQMSWNGLNLDIISGVSALLLFPFARKLPIWSVWVWNTVCLLLLLWVVSVGISSFPGPLQFRKPDNIWVAHFPFIYLPTVAVALALVGHIAVYRKLLWEVPEQSEKSARLKPLVDV